MARKQKLIYWWIDLERFTFTRYDNIWQGEYVIMYYESNNFIYIPVPKCASTSMLATFNIDKYPLIEKEKINSEKFTFTIVRNPYSRLLSCWNGWVRNKVNSRLYKIDGIYKGMSFKSFIKAIQKVPNELCDQHFVPFHTHFNGLKINYTCKLESIDKDWADLSSHINIPNHIMKRAVTGVGLDYQKYYDKESISIVNSKYSKDFEMFNYKKI